MKNTIKLFGIIAFVALVGFSLASCSNGTTGQGGTTNQGGYKTYTAYDEAGNAFILVVTENDTYVLSIQKENGTTLGSSTGTVASSNSTSYTLRNKSGSTFTVIVNVNIIVSINSPIPLDNGGTKSPEGVLSPTKPSGTATKYTVTFDGNGATSGIAPNAQTVTAGTTIVMPSRSGLSKTGFTFGGWNTNAYGTGINYDAGSSYTVTGNVTLYAKWDTDKMASTDVVGTWSGEDRYYTEYSEEITICTLTLSADSSCILVWKGISIAGAASTSVDTSTSTITFTDGTYTLSGNTISLSFVSLTWTWTITYKDNAKPSNLNKEDRVFSQFKGIVSNNTMDIYENGQRIITVTKDT